MAENHYVACTIMAKNDEGRYAFLVKKRVEGYRLPIAEVEHNKTGLACILDNIKRVSSLDVSRLELVELTNAVVKEERIPLFVFTYPNEEERKLDDLLKSEDVTWQYAEDMSRILEDWQFTGVPQF